MPVSSLLLSPKNAAVVFDSLPYKSTDENYSKARAYLVEKLVL
jgi:hypothetical protein